MDRKDLNAAITYGWPKKTTLREHRSSKPEASWNTQDLATEFAAIAYSEGFATPGSVPGGEVGKIINKLVADGFTRYQILQLIRKYFVHLLFRCRYFPSTLWANFCSYAYRMKGTVDFEPPRPSEPMSESELAHQTKMLKLLKGD